MPSQAPGCVRQPTRPPAPGALGPSRLPAPALGEEVGGSAGCERRLLPHTGPREPPAPSVEFFTFDLQEPLSKERVEAFSDGVYAIVATLLILDIW